MPMGQQLKKQLEKLPPGITMTHSDNTYIIPKQDPSKVLTLEPGHFYFIHLDEGSVAKSLMKLTTVNWNNGREITSNYLKCECLQVLSNMVQLNASGYDPNMGIDKNDIYLKIWVNSNIIEIVNELK